MSMLPFEPQKIVTAGACFASTAVESNQLTQMGLLPKLREALANLNPHEVRQTAERAVSLHLIATQANSYTAIADWLLPPSISPAKRMEASGMIYLSGEPNRPAHFDLEIYAEDAIAPAGAFIYYRNDPKRTAREILDAHEELGLPLARLFPCFRELVCERLIQKVSLENAGFALATALPNIAPLIGFGWAVGELASDSVVLTVNQLRLAFLIGAASDRPVGYAEQKSEVAGIIAGAFGWRAVARELVGKIPLGGGIVPKAAISYAGTYVVGKSLERLYRSGASFTRAERKSAYVDAYEHGKQIATSLIHRVKNQKSA